MIESLKVKSLTKEHTTVTVMDLKREIATLEPIAQDELTAFLVQLRLQRDPEHAREMGRRRDDRHPDSWTRLEDFEAEVASGNGTPE